MPNRFAPIAISIVLTIAGCRSKHSAREASTGEQSSSATLQVFAAASLTESFTDIGRQFQAAHPGVTVRFNFAGSQQLREQLSQGAPDDVFASADTTQMDSAVAASLIRRDSVRLFAENRLVVIVPAANPAQIHDLHDLVKPGIRIDIADPSVPVGRYTVRMLEQMSRNPAYGPEYRSRFQADVVSREDNVKAVVSKIRLNEADAGVVYVTDVTPAARAELHTVTIPDSFNQIARYPIGVAPAAARAEIAEQFVQFVLSPDGQKVLADHGFLSVKSSSP